MKSKHIIYYVFNYDKLKLNQTALSKVEQDYDNELYYHNFSTLFNDDHLIQSFEHRHINNQTFILKNSTTKDINFQIVKNRIRIIKPFKVGIIELYLDNLNSNDYLNISRHIFKNVAFNQHDSFNGIYINNQQMVTHDTNFNRTEQYLNTIFFNGAVTNFKLALGRKNFQICSIIDDNLSLLVQHIKKRDDLTIYKIATGEKNDVVGDDTYQNFIDSIYDKWIPTGSIYVLNSHILLQIVNQQYASFTKASLSMYNKIVTVSLIQKIVFIKFQNKSHDLHLHSKFNLFISKFFFIEVSHDNQSQSFYDRLKAEFKIDKYHMVVKEEVNLINSNKTTYYLLIMTFLYTMFALISILITIM